jgi:hypothetical protein
MEADRDAQTIEEVADLREGGAQERHVVGGPVDTGRGKGRVIQGRVHRGVRSE